MKGDAGRKIFSNKIRHLLTGSAGYTRLTAMTGGMIIQ